MQVQYQVRSNAGQVMYQSPDVDDAQDSADDYAAQGWRVYVTFVELIDGQWVAQED